MSIQTDVKVKNLEIKVSQLERLIAQLAAKVDALTPPSKELIGKSRWTTESLRP